MLQTVTWRCTLYAIGLNNIIPYLKERDSSSSGTKYWGWIIMLYPMIRGMTSFLEVLVTQISVIISMLVLSI